MARRRSATRAVRSSPTAAAKGHCSFFPMGPSMIEAHRDELAGFDTAKGTIRFTPSTPIPSELVTRIVRGRIAEIDGS